jgi:uncharacterized protein (TIGR04255 family)
MNLPEEEVPVFPKAPIVEALLDVQLSDAVSFEDLDRLKVALGDAFPTVAEMRNDHIGIAVQRGQQGQEQVTSSRSSERIGLQLTSSDQKSIIQARTQGFSFSRLPPYECWQSFRDAARKAWERYQALTPNNRVARIALRYINRIYLPLPLPDFKRYILTLPELAPDLPQTLAESFMRLRVLVPEQDCSVVVTQVINSDQTERDPSTGELTRLCIILDLDVFKPWKEPVDSNGIWEHFEVLRTVKDEFFMRSLTVEAKELFK